MRAGRYWFGGIAGRSARRGRASRNGQGSAALILMLVMLVLVTAFATALSTSSTTAIVSEARRAAADRAHNAALAGVARATREMKEVAPSIFKRAAAQANASGAAPGTPVLAGLQVPTATLHYNLSDMPGATASDAADVAVSFTLAGPPLQVGLSGLPTSDSASPHQDRYTFRCYLRSTGTSNMGARATSERVANVEVTLVGGLQLTPEQVTSLAASGNIASRVPFVPELARPERSGWDLVPNAYATVDISQFENAQIVYVGPYGTPTGGGIPPPTGAYSGPPVLVESADVGQAAGDNVTYFKMKGLQGATLANTQNAKQATILSVDSWRFQSNYNAALDMIRVNGNYVKGSPEFAVVMLQNKRAEVTALGTSNSASATLVTPRGNVSLAARSDYKGNYQRLTYNGIAIDVAGVPTLGESLPATDYKAVTLQQTGSLPPGYNVRVFSVSNELRRSESIPSFATQSSASQTGTYGDGPGTTAAGIQSIAADVRFGIVSPTGVTVASATTRNSSHLVVGGGMSEIDLSVGCADCGVVVYPPPTSQPYAQIVSVLWMTLATYSVPDSVSVF